MEQGFDINARDDDGVTLMHWAAINNRVQLMKFFISQGAAVDEPGGVLRATPLHWATRYRFIVAFILSFGQSNNQLYPHL